MPSNKLVRVLSSLSLGEKAKATCSCGTAGTRHYEDGGMKEARRIEPQNHPMRLLFVQHIVRSICKAPHTSGLPSGVRSDLRAPPSKGASLLAQHQDLGTHPECSFHAQPDDCLDSDPQEAPSRGENESAER